MKNEQSDVHKSLTLLFILGILLHIVVVVPIIKSKINSTFVGDLLRTPEGMVLSASFVVFLILFSYGLTVNSHGFKRGVAVSGESEEIVRYTDGVQTAVVRFVNRGKSSVTVSLEVDGEVINSEEFKTNYSFQSRRFSGETIGDWKFRYRRHHSGGTQWEIYSVPEAFV